jgi:hypothetical protein
MRIATLGEKSSHRRVVFESDDTRFGTFDGYKQGTDGVLRLATAEWMVGDRVNPVLRPTMKVDIESVDQSSPTIEPRGQNPTGWERHTFRGPVLDVLDDTSSELTDIALFDDTEPEGSGIVLDPEPFEHECSAVVDVGVTPVLVDLSDVSVSVEVGSYIRCTASRTDLLGYATE